jgi:perosamine synthetase
MTFVSTASAAMYLGGKPFFTDITMDDYGMDPESLERAITPKTKIIVPVHYAGQTASMERILQIAKTRGIPVLEDAAEAHLAKYNNRYAGTLGSIGIFSFTPSKPMTTGEGGMIVTNDDELAKKSRLVRNFGDTDKFRWDVLGFNFRMPEVMGAIGRIQLKKLAECVRIRRKIAQAYSEAFAGLEGLVVPYVRRAEDHNFQLYTLRVDSSRFTVGRDQWISELAKRGISARLYYPTLADQAVFSALDGAKVSFKNASLFAQTAFSLPIFPTMTDDQLNQVIEGVRTIHQTLKATR